ncbi:MAG: OmpA family protein [Myxococcales bacterium]|nr:OmpA family protein [Myxococcales bacterium]
MTRREHSILLSILLVLAFGGCGKAHTVHGRTQGLADIVAQAERNGAYRCAPRQLALAKAHLTFAENELAEGDAVRAEQHLAIAEPNAHAAFRMSPPSRCVPADEPAPEPEPEEPPPPPAPGDRDGDGILDPDDRCPDDPEDYDGFEDEDGCPDDQDTDGDGIPDSKDLCPAEPEDIDGYLDTDGCPEPDNDLDGIPDESDRCPLEAEDYDGFEDEDGCPEPDNDRDGILDVNDRCPNEPGPAENEGCPRYYEDVEVTTSHIRIKQTVHFQTNKATIKPESFGLLDTVAAVLRDYPNITVEVQGHTDSVGNDNHNMRLSQARAEAVRDYLIQRGGIDPSRLTARGYGETRPIESNRTSKGRAANRRVEFVRTDEDAPKRHDDAVP